MKISHFLTLVLLFSSAISAGASRGDTFPLDRFTDVSVLTGALTKAKDDATALPRTGADRAHIEKAIESLNAACSDSFTASNIDNLFQNVRQAVTSLEKVQGPKVAAQKIAGDLTEACRVAVEKFLANVERAIPRLTDTKMREKVIKDFTKSREDYAKGIAAISNNRTAAINHFHQAMKRMMEYPLELKQIGPVIEYHPPPGPFDPDAPEPTSHEVVIIHPNGEKFSIVVQGWVWVDQSPQAEQIGISRASDDFSGSVIVDFYDERLNFLRQQEFANPEINSYLLALADGGHFARFQGMGVGGGGNIQFYNSIGDRLASVRASDGWLSMCGFVNDQVFVCAHEEINNENVALGLFGITLAGFDPLTGQKIFSRRIEASEAVNDSQEFLEVDGEAGQVVLHLKSAINGVPRDYTFSSAGTLISVQ